MNKDNSENIQSLYNLNRQEITSILSNSIILLIIGIASGIISFLSLGEKISPLHYLILSIIFLIFGIILCFFFVRVINLGWLNFKIENKLRVEIFGNEHINFKINSYFNGFLKWAYRMFFSDPFSDNSKIYYHVNFKYIIVVNVMACFASSYFFYKYLDKYIEIKKIIIVCQSWLLIFIGLFFVLILFISFYFIRKEFNWIKNEN